MRIRRAGGRACKPAMPAQSGPCHAKQPCAEGAGTRGRLFSFSGIISSCNTADISQTRAASFAFGGSQAVDPRLVRGGRHGVARAARPYLRVEGLTDSLLEGGEALNAGLKEHLGAFVVQLQRSGHVMSCSAHVTARGGEEQGACERLLAQTGLARREPKVRKLRVEALLLSPGETSFLSCSGLEVGEALESPQIG